MFLEQFLLAGAIAFGVSAAVTYAVVLTGKRLGIVDDPAKHKLPKVVHDKPVPRGGGIPIFASLLVGGLLLMPKTTWTLGIVFGSAILAITGFVDDKYEELVSPYLRLIMNVLAALCVIGVGIGIAYITNPAGGVWRLDSWQVCFVAFGSQHCLWILSDLFALLWLVWTQNILGWSSGVDGQLPGFVVVAAVIMGIMGVRSADFSQTMVVILSGLVAGAYLGFGIWNWYPQRIIPGYGGKSLGGFLLGTLAILSGAKVGAMALVLGVPFIDGLFVIFKRLKEGRSPVWGGKEHLHHYLLSFGWSKQKIASFYMAVSAFFGILALQLNSTSKYFTMAVIGLALGAFLVWLHHFSTFLKQHGHDNG